MPGITVESITFSLFGALGDLALRKLFPALYQLDRAGLLHPDTRILALSREGGEPAVHEARIVQALRMRVPAAELDESALERFSARLNYISMDFLRPEDYVALR
jgi:glucose-6-phosphate 1-dehydrogenase